ncbi:MAG: hypothetical protein SVG88_11175 [Halobacteriales archaeon]|nr:hypothetical protein [Halobacteriales archaeon]
MSTAQGQSESTATPGEHNQSDGGIDLTVQNLMMIVFGLLWIAPWLVVARINFIEGSTIGAVLGGVFASLGVLVCLWGIVRVMNMDPVARFT